MSRDAIAGVLIDLDARLTAVEARISAIEGSPIILALPAPAITGGLLAVGAGVTIDPFAGPGVVEFSL